MIASNRLLLSQGDNGPAGIPGPVGFPGPVVSVTIITTKLGVTDVRQRQSLCLKLPEES